MTRYNIDLQITYNEDADNTINFNVDLYPIDGVPVLAVADACIYGLAHAINVMTEDKDPAVHREIVAEVISKLLTCKALK